MNRSPLPLIIIFALLGVVVFFILTDDGSDEATEPSEQTTTTVEELERQFDNSVHVDESDRVLRNAIEAMRDIRAEDSDWYVGVVLEEYETSLRVAARNGEDEIAVIVVTEAECRDDDVEPLDLNVLVNLGDIITWSDDGDKLSVCGDEIQILQVEAVNVG